MNWYALLPCGKALDVAWALRGPLPTQPAVIHLSSRVPSGSTCPGVPVLPGWKLQGQWPAFDLSGRDGVPYDLRSVAVCSSDRATRRRRVPGSCRWFAPETRAPSDARRGWGRYTSPEEAGPWKGDGYHRGFCLPQIPCTQLLGLGPLLLGLGLAVCMDYCCYSKLPHTREP